MKEQLEEEHHLLPPKASNNTRCLLILVSLVAALLLVTTVSLAIALGVTASRESSGVCMTESCVELASQVISSLDASHDPCTDFYNFSCGGWIQTNSLPQGYNRYTQFSELDNANQVALRKILEEEGGKGGEEVEAVKKLKDLYGACVDVEAIKQLGSQPLKELIAGAGGWTLLGVEQNETWTLNGDQFRMEKLLGSEAFFQIYVDVDDKNSSAYTLKLQQSGLTLSSKDLYTDKITPALEGLMAAVFQLVNPGGSANYSAVAKDIVDLETQLAAIFVSNVELRDPVKAYNKMTLSQLGELYSYYDWVNNTKALFAAAGVAVDEETTIIVRTPTYFAGLAEVLSQSNNETLENYAKWHLITSYLKYLDESFLAALDDFLKAVYGTGQQERYQTCIDYVQRLMPIALSRPFTDYVLPDGSKEVMEEMIEAVKKAFVERLEGKDWLDDTTKEKSKAKVEAITKMVAYPEQIHNDTYLNELYSWVDPSQGYFNNFKNYVAQIEIIKDFELLPKEVDKTVWLLAPTDVNAYYSPEFNQFVFLEGILGVPFFHPEWPLYFLYGAMGVVIGHELSHGFDDQGQQYNKDGILTQWWTNQSIANFKMKQQCFRDQYSAFEFYGYNVNGNLTLGENIADNGGLKTSYQAYKNNAKSSQSLPAVSYSPDQLYFIAFAQVWCGLYTPEYMQSAVNTNPHSPGPYRVIGTLQNSAEFASAFSCEKDSPMNPSDKCVLW